MKDVAAHVYGLRLFRPPCVTSVTLDLSHVTHSSKSLPVLSDHWCEKTITVDSLLRPQEGCVRSIVMSMSVCLSVTAAAPRVKSDI